MVRTPFGPLAPGRPRRAGPRWRSLGYNVPLHRTLAFAFAAFIAALGGVLYVWWNGQIAPGNVDLPETINLLVDRGDRRPGRIEGAWIGAFVFVVMQNYITDATQVPLLGFGGTLFGGNFNTLIGLIFLVIVLVSPDGLMGLWDRLFQSRGRIGRWQPREAGRARAHERKGGRRRGERRPSVATRNRGRVPGRKHKREENE